MQEEYAKNALGKDAPRYKKKSRMSQTGSFTTEELNNSDKCEANQRGQKRG